MKRLGKEVVPRAGVVLGLFGQRILSLGTAHYVVLRNDTKQDVTTQAVVKLPLRLVPYQQVRLSPSVSVKQDLTWLS